MEIREGVRVKNYIYIMQVIADLQLHSKFSRAVSRDMTLPNIVTWAKRKGIGLIATGDWTHPLWMKEIERDLEEMGNGFLKLREQNLVDRNENLVNPVSKIQHSQPDSGFHAPVSPLFLLATEVSCIYSQGGKGRRVHTLIWVSSLDSARKISREMTKQGCNLLSDGRPIIGLSNIQVADLVFNIDPEALVIPAHAWTPWFSVFGSMSGFDSLAESFGKFADNIYAIETGLSSNPSMNWQIKELDNRSIVSFSDAHSGPKLGREATVFELSEMTYEALYEAIRARNAEIASKNFGPSSVSLANQEGGELHGSHRHSQSEAGQNFSHSPHTSSYISYTIEFYPEEGKYHYSGHRMCNIRRSPAETKSKGSQCPVCGKPLVQGVMQRVEELAGRSEAELQLVVSNMQQTDGGAQIKMITSIKFSDRPGFVMLVPLQEIIAECIGSPVTSPKVWKVYNELTDTYGGEFNVLLNESQERIAKIAGERISVGIEKVRKGDIVIDPGYDGVFGVVKLWKEGEEKPLVDASKEQLSMF